MQGKKHLKIQDLLEFPYEHPCKKEDTIKKGHCVMIKMRSMKTPRIEIQLLEES
jgi:hypothetical protein